MHNYLRWQTVLARLGVSHVTLWRWVKAGQFPQPVKLSPRCTAFREEDVAAWEASRECVNYAPRERTHAEKEGA